VTHVEVMATAPCPLPILGLALGQLCVAASDPDATLTLFRHTGVVCYPGATATSALEWLDSACTARITQLEAALVRQRGVDLSSTEFTLREVSTRGARRFDLLLPAAVFPQIHAWAREGPWMPLVQTLLGAMPVLDVSVIYSRAGAEDQQWHADGGHRDKVAGWDGAGQSDPYAVCVFVPLIELRPELGATEFWPGTHKFDQLLGFGPVRWCVIWSQFIYLLRVVLFFRRRRFCAVPCRQWCEPAMPLCMTTGYCIGAVPTPPLTRSGGSCNCCSTLKSTRKQKTMGRGALSMKTDRHLHKPRSVWELGSAINSLTLTSSAIRINCNLAFWFRGSATKARPGAFITKFKHNDTSQCGAGFFYRTLIYHLALSTP
jgi:hypothetical protein